MDFNYILVFLDISITKIFCNNLNQDLHLWVDSPFLVEMKRFLH